MKFTERYVSLRFFLIMKVLFFFFYLNKHCVNLDDKKSVKDKSYTAQVRGVAECLKRPVRLHAAWLCPCY